MKAYALVEGPRRKVLFVSDSCAVLWATGAALYAKGEFTPTVLTDRHVCAMNGAYIVRVDYTLGESITKPRTRNAKPPKVDAALALRESGKP